jgi:hypothetical protein
VEDMFSQLGQAPEANPSPIILPDIRYQFSKQFDGTGEVVAILLQIWLASMPVMQIVIPFDRLSFAHFLNAGHEASSEKEPRLNGGD